MKKKRFMGTVIALCFLFSFVGVTFADYNKKKISRKRIHAKRVSKKLLKFKYFNDKKGFDQKLSPTEKLSRTEALGKLLFEDQVPESC